MRRSATATPSSNGSAPNGKEHSEPPLATITWLDDPETRTLLTTLGLLDNGSMAGTTQSYDPDLNYSWSNPGDTFDIASIMTTETFDMSLNRLDSYNFT